MKELSAQLREELQGANQCVAELQAILCHTMHHTFELVCNKV